ncbi:chondroitin proteoglycan 4-like [Amphibalanus amphitrite]|uniref:chondroitin proteoglycan 4-like n=1 Tax=Amphibalanus amphitrite TaxID=1232801 RepID=UPI001C92A49C|nr:chondroitin proteoglycan 4-like [Amphibalanus amphitrite]
MDSKIIFLLCALAAAALAMPPHLPEIEPVPIEVPAEEDLLDEMLEYMSEDEVLDLLSQETDEHTVDAVSDAILRRTERDSYGNCLTGPNVDSPFCNFLRRHLESVRFVPVSDGGQSSGSEAGTRFATGSGSSESSSYSSTETQFGGSAGSGSSGSSGASFGTENRFGNSAGAGSGSAFGSAGSSGSGYSAGNRFGGGGAGAGASSGSGSGSSGSSGSSQGSATRFGGSSSGSTGYGSGNRFGGGAGSGSGSAGGSGSGSGSGSGAASGGASFGSSSGGSAAGRFGVQLEPSTSHDDCLPPVTHIVREAVEYLPKTIYNTQHLILPSTRVLTMVETEAYPQPVYETVTTVLAQPDKTITATILQQTERTLDVNSVRQTDVLLRSTKLHIFTDTRDYFWTKTEVQPFYETVTRTLTSDVPTDYSHQETRYEDHTYYVTTTVPHVITQTSTSSTVSRTYVTETAHQYRYVAVTPVPVTVTETVTHCYQ